MAGEKMYVIRGPVTALRVTLAARAAAGDVLRVGDAVGFALEAGRRNDTVHFCIRAPVVGRPVTETLVGQRDVGEALGWAGNAITHSAGQRNEDRDSPGTIGFVYETPPRQADPGDTFTIKYVWGAG